LYLTKKENRYTFFPGFTLLTFRVSIQTNQERRETMKSFVTSQNLEIKSNQNPPITKEKKKSKLVARWQVKNSKLICVWQVIDD
jgi:hypothetical protein